MTIKLNAYTARQLQDFIGLLDQATSDKKMTLEKLRARIAVHVKKQLKVRPSTVKKPICPKCNKGILGPVINSEGLFIVGCRSCRFSRVVSAEYFRKIMGTS